MAMKSVFLTQPYLLSLKPDREMYVLWIQRSDVPGAVEYGNSHVLGRCVQAVCHEITGLRLPASEQGYAPNPEENPPLRIWQCIARIDNLQPGERVYYCCTAGEERTIVYDFCAAPPPGEPFRLAQISDLQGYQPCEESVYQIGLKSPDLLLYSGDMAFYSWRADQWFDLQEPWQTADSRKRAFFPCMQQLDGARLMQYCPILPCPGNHEVDDLRVGTDREMARDPRNWTYSIYMQLFRPLYPEMDVTLTGKRWYSVDYSDLHITSLSIQRWARWGAYETPGWRLVDEICPGSPQYQWLEEDLRTSSAKFKWVIQHWHLLNKGTDVQNHLCQPVLDEQGGITYPDDHENTLIELYQRYGVHAVSYGHSHVYERYFYCGVHYIEAAYLGCCCREDNAPLHPLGLKPVVEDNSQRSFLIVERTAEGLVACGYRLGEPPEPFDQYRIADEN